MAATWKESLSIGIPEIDKQHKGLCEKVDDLFAACAKGKGRDEITNTLDFLEAYTMEHFADEEKYQIKLKYPKYLEHKKLHTDFLKQVSSLKKELIAEGTSVPMVIKINNLISAWLINHISKADKDIAQYVNK